MTARAYLAGVPHSGELVVVADRVDGGVRTIGFQQRVRGLDVLGGQAMVVLRDGRPFAKLAKLTTYVPAVVPPGRYVIVDDRVAEERIVGRDRVWIAADDGAIVKREPIERDGSGRVTFDVGVREPTVRHDVLAPLANLTVEGVDVTTDVAGGFTWAAPGSTSVTATATGSNVAVTTQDGVVATDVFAVTDGDTIRWSRAADERADAQLAAFSYATRGLAEAKRLYPFAWQDEVLPVRVNGGTGCNASSDGTTIYFGVANATCENTARLADLVYHELGHSFHKHALIEGAGAYEIELSEGLADFFAANLVDDQAIGQGLFRDAQPMRQLDRPEHEYAWPLDRGGDPHRAGLIIASALWDVRNFAGKAVAENVFVGVMLRAPRIDASYLAAQIADDDNGDLTDGTPNGCAIGKAFALHGLAPAFATTTIAQPVFAGREVTIDVTVPTGTACVQPRVVTARYVEPRPEGDVVTDLALTADGDVAGVLGAVPTADPVHWFYLELELDDGRLVRFPDNPADPLYQYFDTPVHPFFCASMDANPMWTASDPLWEYGMPNAPAPDPMRAHTGSFVVGTRVMGNGRYPPGADVQITTPAVEVDLARYRSVQLHYRRWLAVEDHLYDEATIAANGQPVWTNASDRVGTLDHVDREWRFHALDLTPHVVDGKVSVTFGLAADTIGETGGWSLDDVCIVGVGLLGCGNGVIEAAEECDDGNAVDADGCSACTVDLEAAPPIGCCAVGGDRTSALLLGLVMLWFRGGRRNFRAGRVRHQVP